MARLAGLRCGPGAPASPRLRDDRRRRGLPHLDSRNGAPGASRRRRSGRGRARGVPVAGARVRRSERRGARCRRVASSSRTGSPCSPRATPTFTGYISLDDTATWLALTDRTLEEGRSLDGLAPSSYEATLAATSAAATRSARSCRSGSAPSSWARTSPGCSSRTSPSSPRCSPLRSTRSRGRSSGACGRRASSPFVAAQPALLYAYGAVERREGGRRGVPHRRVLRARCGKAAPGMRWRAPGRDGGRRARRRAQPRGSRLARALRA